MPAASTVGGAVGVDGVDDERRGDRSRTARRRRRPWARGRARRASGRPAPSARRRRRSATRRRPIAPCRRAARRPRRRARIGPIDTIGFDGAITTTPALGRARRGPRVSGAAPSTGEAHGPHRDVVAQAHEVVLERRPPRRVAELDHRREAAVGHRQQRAPRRPTPVAISAVDLGRRRPLGEAGRAVQVGGQVAVAEVEPRRAGRRARRAHGRVALERAIACHVSPARPQPRSGSIAPASVYVIVSRSGEIARPCSTVSSPVLTTAATVAGVDARWTRPREEPGRADAAGEHGDRGLGRGHVACRRDSVGGRRPTQRLGGRRPTRSGATLRRPASISAAASARRR